MPKPYFSPDSFWNQPLPAGAPAHPDNARFLELTRWSTKDPALHINLHEWTIPVYSVPPGQPRQKIGHGMWQDWQGKTFAANSRPYLHPEHRLGHHPDFNAHGGVPVPTHARADSQEDGHLAIIDEQAGLAWDMWAAKKAPDGTWSSATGMAYHLDGPGVFDPADFPIRNGESIHLYGPSRATGVPAFAGMIRHADILAGRIEHKLAYAMLASGLLAHHHPPAIWTDGGVPRGIPAGTILQLDPALDLAAFDLSPAARVVARALQEFGAALVDFAGGFTLYGEGLWNDPANRTWRDLLGEDGLFPLGLEHYRYLAPGPLGQTLVEKGMVPFPHKGVTQVYHHHTGLTELY